MALLDCTLASLCLLRMLTDMFSITSIRLLMVSLVLCFHVLGQHSSLAWQACIENEFMRIQVLKRSAHFLIPTNKQCFAQLTCDGNYIIPRNLGGLTKYPLVPFPLLGHA
jgi:hypothetical protein